MATKLKLLIKSLVSTQALDQLYEDRRDVTAADHGVRNRLTTGVAIAITCILVTFMVSLSVKNTDVGTYLASRENLTAVPETRIQASFSLPSDTACDTPTSCLTQGLRPDLSLDAESGKPTYPTDYVPIKPGETRTMLVRLTLDLRQLPLPDKGDLLVKLPKLQFERATAYVGDAPVGSFVGSDTMIFPASVRDQADRTLVYDIVSRITYGQDMLFIRLNDPAFVATHYEAGKYAEFIEARRAGPSNQVANIARIVIAIFALLLFVIIESSPEALGLALFMGFEAIALSGSVGDLRRYWISDQHNLTWFIHYCNAMGDVFRAYFYVQLCRVTLPRPARWLALGSIYALIYGLLRHYEVTFGLQNWPTHHVIQRDLSISVIGVVLCGRLAFHLRSKGVPWRVGALTLAATAAMVQGIGAAPFYFPFVATVGDLFGGFGSILNLLNANAAYLFALSTFVNISTLENRVRVLSREKVRAEAMERELELGRTVQRAFLKLPSMPAEIGMSCHYEAAVYVSGDTYFVHWNKTAQVLTFLLNDVTGHGIQAALKAFACNIIARSIWSRPWVRNERRTEDMRLRKYDEAVVDLICKDGEIPDFNAMVGVEFHLQEKLIRLYRVNYSFPVVVEPNFAVGEPPATLPAQAWTARSLSIPNQTVVEMPLKEGTFVLLISDGFMASARDHHHFIGYLNRSLAKSDHQLNVNQLRQTSLTWEKSADVKEIDDRTLLIFQWNPHAQAADQTGDEALDQPA